MKELPFNEQINNFIANKGVAGATREEIIEAFPKHTPGSISGVLHGSVKAGRIKNIGRGKYATASRKRTFAKKTSLKDNAIKEISELRDSYKYDVSDQLTEKQLLDATVIYRMLNDVIQELDKRG